MAITLDGTNGITTPDVNSDGLTVDTTTLVVDEANNRVGIGTSSPVTVLQVGQTEISSIPTSSFSTHQNIDGDAVNYFFNSIQATSGSTNETTQLYLGWRDAASGIGVAPRIVAGKEGDYTTAGNAKAYLSFSTVSNNSLGERARIDSSGALLVGTTSNSGEGWTFEAVGYGVSRKAGTADSVHWSFKRGSNTEVGKIQSNGSSTSYVTSSDYRLKENVVGVTGASARVQQLNPVRFNFIADPDRTVDGFLAHEVQDVVPEAITGTRDEVDAEGNPVYQGIDQSKLVPLLTAALQEALTKIETLEARVAALEAA